jgi:hypothetical protein
LQTSSNIEFQVLPISASLAGLYDIRSPNHANILRTGVWHRIDIAAVDETGAVDTSYSGTVLETESGMFATTDAVPIEHGFGNFIISRGAPSDVTITLTGELFSPAPVILHFVAPGQGASIAIVGDFAYDILAAEERELLAVVMSTEGPAPTYTGIATTTIYDPDGDGSVTCPSSVPITGGIGRLTFSDSEPETVILTLSAPGLIEFQMPIISHAALHVDLSETLTLDADHVISMSAVDFYGNTLTAINVSLGPTYSEFIPNGTCTLSPYTPSITAGVGTFMLRDSEQESVAIYMMPLDNELVIVPNAWIGPETGYYVGTAFFSNVRVSEKTPKQFSIGQFFPNPFNAATTIKIDMPQSGKLSLDVLDISGRIVSHSDLQLSVGSHTISLPCKDLLSGIYFARFSYSGKEFSRKAVLVK